MFPGTREISRIRSGENPQVMLNSAFHTPKPENDTRCGNFRDDQKPVNAATRRIMSRASLILGLLLGATTAAVTGASAQDGYYANPARDIEFSNVQHLGRSPRILMPTLYVKFARWGRASLALGAASATGAVVDVDAPISVDDLRTLAGRLQEDLASQLSKVGWDVLNEADVKDKDTWKKLEHAKADRRFGVPFEEGKVDGNPRRYLIVAPANLPVIAAGATGPAWTMKELVDEMNATVLVATYTFDVIPFVSGGSGDQPVAPRLQLVDVSFDFRTPGLVGGVIRAKVPETCTESTGKFGVPGVKDDKLAQALQDTANGRGKGELILEPDATTLVSTGFSVGSEFNAKVVKIISAFAPK